jgi:hypothetical protein
MDQGCIPYLFSLQLEKKGFLYLRQSRLKALGYTSKCIEAVPAEDRTWIAGVRTGHFDH